jgi:hypothetical protein
VVASAVEETPLRIADRLFPNSIRHRGVTRAVLLLVALLGAVPAFAQVPSIVNSLGYLNGASLTTHTTTAFDSTGASTLVAFGSGFSAWNGMPVSIAGVSDNMGNTWHVLTGPTTWIGQAYPLLSAIYYVNAPVTSATHTVTLTLTNGAPLVAHVFAVSGSDITGPPIYSPITDPGAADSSVAVSSQAVTVPSGSLLLGWVRNETGGVTATTLGGFTLDAQSTSYLWAESQTVFSAGTYAANFSFSLSTGWQTAVVALNPPH